MASGLENIKTIESPFRRFVTTIGVFPTAFTDAMTYYECLAYLVKYLEDTVVPAVNENAEALAELQDYVTHYFDNLDVQDEINNKLDQMAEDGTLQEIITAYIQANVTWTFDTVADMKNATNLIAGSYARTLGFHAINDGGASVYYITDTGTADEMSIIKVGDLYANLVLPTVINPEIFGAYGDGTHDDVIAIQKAVSTGKPILLSKNYLISDTVEIGGTRDYSFDGKASSVTYNGAGSAFKINNIYGANISFGKIVATNGNCIELSATDEDERIIFLNLSFDLLTPAKKALYVHNSGTGYINEITYNGGRISNGEHGVYITSDPTSNTYQMNGHRFNHFAFEGCSTNYYIDTNSSYIRGFEFNDDRYVENTTSTMFEIIGNVRFSALHSWGTLSISRLNFTDASFTSFGLYCPIYNADSSKKIADGIYYDRDKEYYISNYPIQKTLTKETGVDGTITTYQMGNMVVLNFNSLTFTSGSMTLVSASNNPLTPVTRFRGTISASDGTSAVVTIESDGSITLSSASGSVGKTMFGSLTYPTFVPLQ